MAEVRSSTPTSTPSPFRVPSRSTARAEDEAGTPGAAAYSSAILGRLLRDLGLDPKAARRVREQVDPVALGSAVAKEIGDRTRPGSVDIRIAEYSPSGVERTGREPSVQRATVTPEQASMLLARTEGHFLDFKSAEIRPAKMTRSLSAFCNADGGDLYVGIAENGSFTWDGFANEEEANGHLQAFEEVSPLGDDLDAEFMQCPGNIGLVLHVNARKSRFVRTASDGRAYRRLGAQNRPVAGDEELRALRRQKGIESFEDETLTIPLSDVTNSLPILEYMLAAIPSAEPEIYLKGQYLIHGERPTVAAVLLFAERPQAALPKRCGIKVYRYSSTETSRARLVQDPISIEGHLYKQIHDAVAATTAIIQDAAFLDAGGSVP